MCAGMLRMLRGRPSLPVSMNQPHSDLTHPEVRGIIFGIMLAMFLGALDQTIIATALPTIGAHFGDFTNLPWVVTAYLVAATVATPLYGKLSDIHGRRVMLLIAISVFSVASVICALAPSLLILVLARFLQGLGGGGLISLAQTIIADVVSPIERPRYQAQIAAVFGLSSVAGPVLGGFLAENLDWSVIFWINLPLGLAAFLMTDRRLRRLPRHERRHDLDVPGALFMAISAICLLLALTWGGVRQPWTSPLILSLFGVGLLATMLFFWRIRTAHEPFLSLDMLTHPVVGRAVPASFAGAGTMLGLTVFVPLYFEDLRGFSASQSGLGLIPLMAGVVGGAIISGRSIPRLVHYKRPGLVGLIVAPLLLLAIAAMPQDMPIVPLLASLAVIGVGIGMTMPLCLISIQNAVPPHRMGTATGVMNFFRQLGGAFVVAVLGAVLLGVVGGTAAGHDVEAMVRDAAGPQLGVGFSYVFATAALILFMGFLFLLTMEEMPLRTSVRMAAEEGALISE